MSNEEIRQEAEKLKSLIRSYSLDGYIDDDGPEVFVTFLTSFAARARDEAIEECAQAVCLSNAITWGGYVNAICKFTFHRLPPVILRNVCPKCNGLGETQTLARGDWFAIPCNLCSGSGDLLQGEMTEARARAILKAARELTGGYTTARSALCTYVVIYSGVDSKWKPVCLASEFVSSEYVFEFESEAQAFLSSPRVTESLTYIFTPRKDNEK